MISSFNIKEDNLQLHAKMTQFVMENMAPPWCVALLLLNAALEFSRKLIPEFYAINMASPIPFVSPFGSDSIALFESNCIVELPLKVMSQLSYA